MSEQKIFSILNNRSDGRELIRNLQNIKEKAEPLLARIVEIFPEYSSHDISHSERIIRNYNFLIPDSLFEKLNSCELFFLISGAYLHDIGKVDYPDFPESAEQNNIEIKREIIRNSHHIRSEQIINKHFKNLGIRDVHQAKIIGKIARGHRKENLSDENIFSPDFFYTDESINIPLLASLLRIADELDLSFERISLIVYDLVPPKDPISKDEWEKHLEISGGGLHPENPLIIKFNARCKNPNIHRALKRLETKINTQIEDLPNHLHQYMRIQKDLPRKFEFDIDPEGHYKVRDFKFTLEEKAIVNLLMGEKLYERKEESLRELIKNSIDACRLKKKLSECEGSRYTPEIIFEVSPDFIKIRDNGIGMDEYKIETYFLKIGSSFYNPNEIEENGIDFTPLSELGIGFLSCFMIAEKIHVDTKTDESEPILFEIEDVSDYLFVKDGNISQSGTEITLFLTEEAKKIDFIKEIQLYAHHLDIPIKIETDVGTIKTKDFSLSENLREVMKTNFPLYDYHLIKLEEDFVKGYFGFLLKKDSKFGLIPATYEHYWIAEDLQKIIKDINNISFISNNGIFVTHKSILSKALNFVFIDFDLQRNFLDLNAARNSIVQNKKYELFSEKIDRSICNKLIEYFSSLKEKFNDNPIFFAQLCTSFIGTCFKDYIVWNYQLRTDQKEIQKRDVTISHFSEFFINYYYLETISTDGFEYKNPKEILNQSKKIIFLSGCPSVNHAYQILQDIDQIKNETIYIVNAWNPWNENYILKMFFKNINGIDFSKYINTIKKNELVGIIPKKWNLVKITNYNTKRMIEYISYPKTIINIDNNFISLLVKNIDKIRDDKTFILALKGFFKTLKSESKGDFKKFQSNQLEILDWFVRNGLIKSNNLKKYQITVKDFPPDFFDKLNG